MTDGLNTYTLCPPPSPPNHSPLPHQQVCKVSKSTPARGFKNIKIKLDDDFSRIEAIKHITQKKTDLRNSFFLDQLSDNIKTISQLCNTYLPCVLKTSENNLHNRQKKNQTETKDTRILHEDKWFACIT